MTFSSKKSRSGYTLVELLVAIGVFSVITTIAVGGFVKALRTHRQALAVMAANSNVANALEQMARELRTGQNFTLVGSALIFDNASQESITYELVGSQIIRNLLGNPQPLTDDNVDVEYLDFTVLNLVDYPPRVIIAAGVRPNLENADSGLINIQTAVSSRNF